MAAGTGIFTLIPGKSIYAGATDINGNYMWVYCAATYIPSGTSGYGVGCLLTDTTNGYLYINTGSSSSCSFTRIT